MGWITNKCRRTDSGSWLHPKSRFRYSFVRGFRLLHGLAILICVLLVHRSAVARAGYLQRTAPSPLGVIPRPPSPWDAIMRLPPLDTGEPVLPASGTAASAETPALPVPRPDNSAPLLAPLPSQTPEPESIIEVLKRLLSVPDQYTPTGPVPLQFIPPSPPSSSATFIQPRQ